MAALIRVENLGKRYGIAQIPVLDGVSFTVKKGEFVAIMGPSGSGKSTLMHLIGGIDHPDEGEVYIEDRCINGLDDKELSRYRRRHIGFVFQFYNLIPVLTARDNVAMPLILDGVKRADALEQAVSLLETVGLKKRSNNRPGELSGGEQQRVAIARALVSNPTLILADEPTGALDTQTGDEIVGLLRYTVETLNHTVIMVTHDPRVAANARRIIYLRDGRIADDNHIGQTGYGSSEIAGRLRTKV